MLTLQRASAGSGKTFTLARTFIRHLITYTASDGSTRLRPDEAIHEALPHILAVTFTNKATNEMKQRIVEKLFALSRTDTPAENTDYLRDFMEEFGVERNVIAQKCRIALKHLLLAYSDFNVSTIDSFFQSILRTFAYESELPDSYRLEIDTDFISAVGVDSVIDSLINSDVDKETLHWINHLSSKTLANGKDWNILNRKVGSGGYGGDNSLYKTLIDISKSLDSESFKQVSGSIDRFFENNRSLSESYEQIESHFMEGGIKDAFYALRAASTDLYRAYCRIMTRRVRDVACAKAIERLKHITAPGADPAAPYEWTRLTARSSPLNKQGKELADKPTTERLRALHDAVSDAHDAWRASFRQPWWEVWAAIRLQIPYLALIHRFRDNIREYLESNNMMVLGDTNTLLRRIIADDEVPFIYERLGSRIDHYLIDEFQDTSRMQWDNFRPLLAESISKGMDNLIIGDAKQSIYRFRNADPSIITDIVPATFLADRIAERGTSVEENSNWRSDLRIVQFNNYIFNRFHEDFKDILGNLYAGAVQYPRQRKSKRGYVEWTPFSILNERYACDDDKYGAIAHMIMEMLSRGYRQRDIAILCNRNTTGLQVIDSLMAFNASLPADAEQLRFVSEQSLTLGSNRAVQVVIAALRSLSEGIYTPPREGEEMEIRGRADWTSISTRFCLFSFSHPEMGLDQRITEFFRDIKADDRLSDMVAAMQATTLPALVEAIIDNFVHTGADADKEDTDTPFLAAFQDAVLDYCDSKCADIASFLEWWDKKGENLSISSPEDTDAISIMTIHKSKGLEFECVILPDIDISFEPGNKSRWVWTPLPESFPFRDRLPDYVPVALDASLEGLPSESDPETVKPGPFAPLWQHEKRMVLTDNLNKIYVAFTRAVSELYILTGDYKTRAKEPKLIGDGRKLVNKLCIYLHDAMSLSAMAADDSDMLYPDPAEIREPQMFGGMTYGEKPSPMDVAQRIAKRMRDAKAIPSEEITGYYVNSDQPLLAFTEDGYSSPDPYDEDRADPRSEGSLIHEVLEQMETYGDLHRAVGRMRIKGRIDSDGADALEAMLADALEATSATCWFDGSMRVVNERPLLRRRSRMSRPDRLLVSRDGRTAIVVDYKCGVSLHNSKHHAQVRSYMKALQESGMFDTVEGWLWYVKEGKIQKVDPR